MQWFFSYGLGTDVEQTRAEVGVLARHGAATLPDYIYTFTGHHPEFDCATSTLVPVRGGLVLGVAYELTDSQIDDVVTHGHGYALRQNLARFEDRDIAVVTLQPTEIGPPGLPSAEYLGRVRRGLRQHYPHALVEAYLQRALARAGARPLVPRRRSSPDQFREELGVATRRLFPWEATKTGPFGSAWVVVKPGQAVEPHCHDEQEAFICLSGRGIMSVDGLEFPVTRGDTLYLEPFAAQSVRPEGDEPLEFLCLSWDAILPTTATTVRDDGSLSEAGPRPMTLRT
jgi:mannose-6-phosphate isomerase-like protein (cupin superfamily)